MFTIKIRQTLSIGLIGLLLGFPQLSETIYTPSLPDLARHLQVEVEWAEFTLSIYFMGFALGVFCWGMIADWLGRRPAMLWGLIFYIAGSWGCYQSQEMTILLIYRFIQAFGASTGSVVTQTMIRDVYTGLRRNQIFSIVGGILAFSPALGPFLGGWIDERFGWQGNFAFLVIMGCCLFTYIFLKLPETKPPLISQKHPMKQVISQFLTDSRLWGYIVLIGGCNGIIFSYYAEAPFLFIELLDLTPVQYGLTGMIVAIASFTSAWLSHQLNSRQVSHELIIMWGCMIVVFVSSILSLVFYQNIFRETTVINLTVILGLVGGLFLGIGLIIPNSLSQALISYQQTIGTAGALLGLIYYILIAVFTFGMGILHNGNAITMPLYFLLISCSMSYVFYTRILSKKIVALDAVD